MMETSQEDERIKAIKTSTGIYGVEEGDPHGLDLKSKLTPASGKKGRW